MSEHERGLCGHPTERWGGVEIPTLARRLVEADGHPARRFGLIVTHTGFPEVACVTGDVVLDGNGRFRLANLLVIPAAGHHVGTNLWRIVPVAKIETVLNDPKHREHNLESSPDTVHFLSGLDWLFEWVEREAAERNEAEGHKRKRKPSLLLSPWPDGPKYPDSFYKKVAAAYSRLAQEGRPPSQVLADVNDVPKTTVNRWVREARARGLLAAAGGKGRIG